ncbi:primary amine oxidase-like [Pyrus ussuriensis x Pyrus communis]|uniref:Primary amine oxidase-like n=1 Tax=Pyrus ussuriensis x Pyrus communis TaxID=2448454 RepID=A0A5N5GX36_9ROSA|nr:primary amine oxidase-like [Pyrus ussuriensis x Pyrus communis]KAB2624130.1 primary amine oxidase-like [Pyrus ussuriensis x Pyrus communis]
MIPLHHLHIHPFPDPLCLPQATCCDTCDDRGLYVEERVVVLPSEDEGLIEFLELDGVERMGVKDGADNVKFLDGEGVERVVGGVGDVVFEAGRWDMGIGCGFWRSTRRSLLCSRGGQRHTGGA